MAQPVLDRFEPLPPLWPDEPPRVLITLPSLPGPEAADEFVRRTGGVDGTLVVVDARRLGVASMAFAERIIRRLFAEGAIGIDFVVPPLGFMELALAVAERLGTADRIRERDANALQEAKRRMGLPPA